MWEPSLNKRASCIGTGVETMRSELRDMMRTNQTMDLMPKIKDVKTSDMAKFKEFEYHRRQAILSMNEERIKHFYEAWEIPFPPEGEGFWEAVATNILRMNDAPPAKRVEAVRILDELNIEFEE